MPTSAQAATASQAFTTPGEQVFTVPPAVTSVNVVLVGGQGGTGREGELSGAGATVEATIAVFPGETLYAEVGGDGTTGGASQQAGAGGFNGGGTGGDRALFTQGASAGGGGGASDVRTIRGCPITTPTCPALHASLSSRLVVAGGGGGGGGGWPGPGNPVGGTGGAADADGNQGQHDSLGDSGAGGGARGTIAAGGAAGAGYGSVGGSLGIGGDGGTGQSGGGGGGGGGGLFGGGGGGGGIGAVGGTPSNPIYYGPGGGGGGGGASTIPPGPAGVTNLSLIPTAANAQPQITFTWTVPPPSATTQAASAVSYSAATLHGTVNPNATPLSSCQFTISPAPPGGSTISCAKQIGSGTAPVPVSAQLFGLAPSTTYTVRLTTTDAQGQSTGAPITFRTLPPPPSISGLKVSVTRHHRRRHGTIKLRVTQSTTLAFGFERRKGKRWVAVKRTLAARAKAGTATIGFNPAGLSAGRYRVTVVATNSVGERSAPQQAVFAISR